MQVTQGIPYRNFKGKIKITKEFERRAKIIVYEEVILVDMYTDKKRVAEATENKIKNSI